jgi:hypothetical protein
MAKWVFFLVTLAVVVVGAIWIAGPTPPLTSKGVEIEAVVTGVDTDKGKLALDLRDGNPPHVLQLDEPIKGMIKDYPVGSIVKATLDKKDLPTGIVKAAVASRNVSWLGRFTALALAGAFILLIAFLATDCDPRKLLIGLDGRYSNSQCQVAFWFGTAMTVYLAALSLRLYAGGWSFFGGVDIPTNVLALSGLSALTFGGARAITTQKVNTAVAEGNPSPSMTAPQLAEATRIRAAAGKLPVPAPATGTPDVTKDLVTNNHGKTDIGDFQMIFVTLVAIVTYMLQAAHGLGTVELLPHIKLPDVDTTLLAAFGLGQGAYLVKKAASDVGHG